MKRIVRNIPEFLLFLFLVYVVGMLLFSIPRIIIYFQHYEETKSIPNDILWQSFVVGFRFDSVVSTYILAVPLLVCIIVSLFRWNIVAVQKIILWYLIMLYSLSFFMCAADIPFFNFFNYRLMITATQWFDSPQFVASMIFNDASYYPYIALFLLLSAIFIIVSKRIQRKIFEENFHSEQWKYHYSIATLVLFSIFSLGIVALGIRGRIAVKSPIRWGTAFFSTYPFANQLGLNPVFTFFRSWLDEQNPDNNLVYLLDDEIALRNVRKYFHVESTNIFDSPIAREIKTSGEQKKYNVIIVLMESMSAEKMMRYGSTKNLTPNLDSIANHSIVFDNFFSSGIHTHNGIYSTTVSFPSIFAKHPMNTFENLQSFTGIANTLLENNYATLFFTTHDDQFDNMGGFLSYNGFQKIISQRDYPQQHVVGTLGVPDGVMFEQSLSFINSEAEQNKQFLAMYLTGSHHGPWIIPEDIPLQLKGKNGEEKTLEYADWAIGNFLELSQKQTWYRNTIFIFLGDHGSAIHRTNSFPLSFNHTPFILYAPFFHNEHRVLKNFGGQIDVFPTVMGLLNIPYINNTFGIDLLKEEREFMYFSADDKIGCINEEYFLVLHRQEEREYLFRYRENAKENIADTYPQRVQQMKEYAYSHIQAAQWMLIHKKAKKQIPIVQ
ncbi:MAG: LTA synthase family protein [Ignavibacteria bacterium]|nr:LTA synthase family protein [Ignavibacteria bacterium]